MSEQLEEPLDGKKLFMVAVSQEIAVIAADEREAESIARSTAMGACNLDWRDGQYEALEVESVPKDWKHSLPWGEEKTEKTCQQILDAWADYERNRPPTKAELEAMGQQRLVG